MKPIGAKMRAHRRGSHVPVPYTFLKAVPLHTLGAAFAEVAAWQMRRPQGPRTLASHWRRGGRYCLPTFLKYRALPILLAAPPSSPRGAAFALARSYRPAFYRSNRGSAPKSRGPAGQGQGRCEITGFGGSLATATLDVCTLEGVGQRGTLPASLARACAFLGPFVHAQEVNTPP
jgi:hypothetical protein